MDVNAQRLIDESLKATNSNTVNNTPPTAVHDSRSAALDWRMLKELIKPKRPVRGSKKLREARKVKRKMAKKSRR